MNFLTSFGLNKSRLTVLVMIGLLIQGLLVYLSIPKRENPAITIRNAIVSVQFPGMAPERMEDLIVVPIERKVREIGEVEDIMGAAVFLSSDAAAMITGTHLLIDGGWTAG